jgi:hypothetical protein
MVLFRRVLAALQQRFRYRTCLAPETLQPKLRVSNEPGGRHRSLTFSSSFGLKDVFQLYRSTRWQLGVFPEPDNLWAKHSGKPKDKLVDGLYQLAMLR